MSVVTTVLQMESTITMRFLWSSSIPSGSNSRRYKCDEEAYIEPRSDQSDEALHEAEGNGPNTSENHPSDSC